MAPPVWLKALPWLDDDPFCSPPGPPTAENVEELKAYIESYPEQLAAPDGYTDLLPVSWALYKLKGERGEHVLTVAKAPGGLT